MAILPALAVFIAVLTGVSYGVLYVEDEYYHHHAKHVHHEIPEAP